MSVPPLRRLLLLLASVLTLTFGGLAAAEPPTRAARLGQIDGTVSLSPGGHARWVSAGVNRPLTSGDRLWVDGHSRAEVQLGGAAIRMGAATHLTLLNLDDRIAQLRLMQGTLIVRVRHLAPGRLLEVNTPNLALTLRRPGEYRIEVDPSDDATAVMVYRGAAEAYGRGASYAIQGRRGYRFYGTGLSDYEALAEQPNDDLLRWARLRDSRADRSPSARYVSNEVVGYEDLDANGTWRIDPSYGAVWTPTRVAAGWTPYRDGHWAWIDPWGWTWVDDAPWGYAVSHYGRWANIGGSWAWVPGPPKQRAVFAPALVAFVGGKNFRGSLTIGGSTADVVGWFPLAPREVYQPSYPVSRAYFESVNRSNTVIAPSTITRVYNATIVNNTTIISGGNRAIGLPYANQQVGGAVVAVPAAVFAQAQPVAKSALALSREAALSAPIARVAAVAPVEKSVQGGAAEAAARPSAQLREREVIVRTMPPPPPVPFAAQQPRLAAKPGAPIDEAQRAQLKPASPAASAPPISVVTAAQAPVPTAVPPAAPPAGRMREARRSDEAKHDADRAPARRVQTAPDAAPAASPFEAMRAEAAKADAARAEASKAEAARAAAAKAETSKIEAMRAEAAKADAARAEASKAEAARAAAAKAETSKIESMRAEAAKADALKAAAAKAEASRLAAEKGDAAKAAAERAEAAKADAAKANPARARAEPAGEAASRAELARAPAPGRGRGPISRLERDDKGDDEGRRPLR